MKMFSKLTFEGLLRLVADVLIVNFSYLAALVIRLLWKMATTADRSAFEQIVEAAQIYGATFWLLSISAIVVYGLCGIYTRARFYRSRFKVLAIFQGVSLSYIVFGFMLYFSFGKFFGDGLLPPRVALILAWFLTFCCTTGARLWSTLWRLAIKAEVPTLRQVKHNERIHHVLIIGGAGYIGSVLARKLLQLGYSVRILDTLLYGQDSIAELAGHPRFTLVEGDSRDVSAVFKAMLDMDAVVHLGELVGDPACALDKRLTLEINLAATRMVAEAAQGCGVKRFIYASSCSVYGYSSDLLDERSTLNPVSLYAQAKIGSEHTLLELNGPDFHPAILRFATVYGLSPRPRFDLVVNLLAAKAVCDGEITIFGGEQWRPFVHVADVAQAITLCLTAPLVNVKARVFNVGADEQNYTISQVGQLVQRVVPEAKLINQGDGQDQRSYHVSFARIRHELGFKPRFTVEDGIQEIVTELRTGHIKDYGERRFSNYKTLSDPSNHLGIRSRRIIELYAPTLPVGEPKVVSTA
jgi:nucleoside-diphosphate-sugar epimerase